MKKILLVVSLISVLLLTGCGKEENTNVPEVTDNQQQIDKSNISGETAEMSTIEIRGVKYKDINTIPKVELDFDSSLVYATPIKEGNDIYVKLSDSFIIEDFDLEENTSNQRIMLPTKIYSSEENVNYLYNYNGETYYIPVEKCLIGEEKIVYRDYGMELIKANDSIKINGIVSNDVIDGWFYDYVDYDVSLCEAYMESWKISDKMLNEYSESYLEKHISRISEFTNIFQVDFDDDKNTLEFIYASDIVGIDMTFPAYCLITYSNENGIRNFNDDKMQKLAFNNILNYKNVFYGNHTICTKEIVITGYYIYDKDVGFVYVDRFSNGNKFDENGFKELSKISLTLDGQHTIKETENGEKYIDAFPLLDIEYLFDEDGNIVTNEDGSYKENPNSKHIEDGTKIYINFISEDGQLIKFKTEDGQEYSLTDSYV